MSHLFKLFYIDDEYSRAADGNIHRIRHRLSAHGHRRHAVDRRAAGGRIFPDQIQHFLKFFHFNDPVYKVLAVILAAGFPIFISLVLPTYSPFELLWIVLQYQRTKHYAKYNPRLKWEKMPDYLIQSRLDPIEAIRDFGERMIKERASREAIINENITNPTHDERFIEDRKYLEDRDLVPDELKSSAQLKAEKRERKKQEKELRAEQNRQIREAKKREREEKKSSRKKEFLTEEKGEDNGV